MPTRRCLRPVISVGNLAMGGRGKTPTVAAVAEWLIQAGERPAILSRGYGRTSPEDEVVVVSDGTHLLADLDRSGDEPLMLARQVRGAVVLVCDVRAAAARLAEERYNVTVHLLDDGFQHRSLGRDIDLVIVAPEDLGGHRMPFGRLRSSPRSLARAHAVLVDGATADDVRSDLDALVSAGPKRFSLRRRLEDPWLLEERGRAPHHDEPVVAVAAIASPERFTRALETAGWRVVKTVGFRDHHAFTMRDMTQIADTLAGSGARLVVTTEKDAMRMLPLRPLPVPVAAVPLRVSIDPMPEFGAWLRGALDEVRR